MLHFLSSTYPLLRQYGGVLPPIQLVSYQRHVLHRQRVQPDFDSQSELSLLSHQRHRLSLPIRSALLVEGHPRSRWSDTLHSGALAHHPLTFPPGTGFVVASCTDPTYESSACNQHCTSNPDPDVVYNPDTGLWACCSWSDGVLDCNNPTDETWAAPAPSVLLAAASAHSTIVSTSTSSSSSSTTSSSSSSITSSATTTSTNNAAGTTGTSPVPASTASSSSSSGLSTGAKAGIGVGVSLGVLLLALAFFSVYRVGKKSRQPHNDASAPLARTHESNKGEWGGGNHGYKQGMSGERYMGYGPPGQAIEMHGNSASELPVTAPRDYSGRGGAIEI